MGRPLKAIGVSEIPNFRRTLMDMSRHGLPRIGERWTVLYVEKGSVERDASSVALFQGDTATPLPVSNLAALLLGPGTSISQAAVRRVLDSGCCLLWTGEQGVRLYGFAGPMNSTSLLEAQVRAWADPQRRFQIAEQMYRRRFGEESSLNSIPELLAAEGRAMRAAYQNLAELYGIEWWGRDTDRDWQDQDPPNRALSAAATCLYGVSAAAISTAGLCPGLGFLHSGDPRSLVFDVADLYRLEYADVAWSVLASGAANLESSVRRALRDAFFEAKQIERTLRDLSGLFGAYP